MLLIAVRHGETEWNVNHREMGQLDSPLTPRGVQQAQALARRISGIKFDALYSSDLGRAVQTAEFIAALSLKKLQLDPGLRERHMGEYQGLTFAEIQKKFPEQAGAFERDGFFNEIPGGESEVQRMDRGVRAFTVIAERHPDQTVVAVSHGGLLTGMVEFVLGIPFKNKQRFKKQNASFNAFEYVNSKWCLLTWNDISHLAGLTALDDPSGKAG